MFNIKTRVFLSSLTTIIALTGCDSIPFMDNSPDYQGASRGKPLEVPPDLTSISSSDVYTVPGSGTTYSEYSEGQTQYQQEEKILPTPDSVKMERAGSQRWLVVDAPVERIWPVVRDFWTELGFAVRVENPQTGVMETEWVDTSNLTKDENQGYLDKFQGWLDKLNTLANRQKFRTRLDRGAESGTTEIFLSHRTVSDPQESQRDKVRTIYGDIDVGYKNENLDKRTKQEDARAIAEDIDAELLRRLMVRLGVEESKSRAIVASGTTEQRATLGKNSDGSFSLAAIDPFDRAWRRVGLALDRIGFIVEDRDRSAGAFYVRYSDFEVDNSGAKQEKGWLDKLKFWSDDEVKDKSNPENQYVVKVVDAENGSSIYVTDRNGKRERSGTANRILSMLYDQLK